MYKLPLFLFLVILGMIGFGGLTVAELLDKNQHLTEENKYLKGKVVDQALKNDSLKALVGDFSQTLEAYQQLLKEVGILVQRQCPEMFKHHKEHGPSLRRPQSLPDPEDLPKAAPRIEM